MSAKQTTELDADIVAAFEALDATTPQTDLDGFEARLLARLEEEDMSEISNETTTTAEGQTSAAPGSAERRGSDDSELHDIRALARSTKLRISQRMIAQADAEEELLSASSPSLALRTIALPEPGKEYPAISGDSKPAATAAVHDEDTGLPAWIYAAISAVAAAAIVFFILRGQKPEQPQVALNDPQVAIPADSPAPTGSGVAQPGTAATGMTGDMAGGADMLGGASPGGDSAMAGAADGDEGQAGADGQAKDSSAEDRLAATSARSSGAGADSGARTARRTSASAADKKAQEAGKSAAATAPSDDAAGDMDNDSVKAAKKPEKKPDALEDLLAEASGGAAAGNTGGAGQQAGAAETKPTRTQLERGDIKKAMTPIGPKAQACYDETQLSGMVTVMIEFRVEPSGAISSASAKGKFKGTPTGDCVAGAVKTASLPAYDGAPMSFTYPFLLTQ